MQRPRHLPLPFCQFPQRCWCTLALLFALVAGDEAEEPKSGDILEVMSMCKYVDDGLDWGQVFKLAKSECRFDAPNDALLRIQCSAEGLAVILDGTRLILHESTKQSYACANGLVFILAVALAYTREMLSAHEVSRAQVLLWQALQDNFMLDASMWPVKTFDVLELFDRLPAALDFPGVPAEKAEVLDLITFVVPRCHPDLAAVLAVRFPGARVVAGVPEDSGELPEDWVLYRRAWERPTGSTLNRMLAAVDTPFVLVVTGTALPLGHEDLERMARALQQRRIVAVAGPVITEQRVFVDFCYKLRLRHYHIGFDPVYTHSLIFDEDSASSIRGNWFHEEAAGTKDGPCKLCETLPPTFLARTDALQTIGFHPAFDSEWALLEFALRASRTPLVHVRQPGAAGDEGDGSPAASAIPPGRRHSPVAFAVCPAVNVREVDDLGMAHLYGRRDMPDTGVSPAEPWFGDEAAGVGPSRGPFPRSAHLRPSHQAELFMQTHHLRDFTGPEGIKRHFGCNVGTVNCPVPDWVYRGWAVPPCCKETMRHLLFYIDEVFREVGVQYIITDGVLLGSYKFGGLLDWDADVDLHIHDNDFWRLEELQHRVKSDGHFLRRHANNQSWLLQANDHNYLLIELNKRQEHWDPERVWYVPIEGRLFPAMEDAHVNLSSWYGLSYFRHRLRHVPEWEEDQRPMYCATPYHFNCVDETQVASGHDCQHAGIC